MGHKEPLHRILHLFKTLLNKGLQGLFFFHKSTPFWERNNSPCMFKWWATMPPLLRNERPRVQCKTQSKHLMRILYLNPLQVSCVSRVVQNTAAQYLHNLLTTCYQLKTNGLQFPKAPSQPCTVFYQQKQKLQCSYNYSSAINTSV